MPQRTKLTRRTVDGLRPGSQTITVWDSELPGFGIKIFPSGRKSYLFRYRVGGGRGGTSREPVIGAHGALTPDEARTIAKAWAREVATGGDPGATRRAQRVAPRMGELFERYLAEYAERHKKAASRLRI